MFKVKRRHDATTFDSDVNGFIQSSLAFLRILACVTNTQANTMFKKHKAAGHDGIIFFKILFPQYSAVLLHLGGKLYLRLAQYYEIWFR